MRLRLLRLVVGLWEFGASFSTNEKQNRFFPRFEQVTRKCEVHRAVCSCFDWSEYLLWFWFFDSHLKTALCLLHTVLKGFNVAWFCLFLQSDQWWQCKWCLFCNPARTWGFIASEPFCHHWRSEWAESFDCSLIKLSSDVPRESSWLHTRNKPFAKFDRWTTHRVPSTNTST